MSSSWQAGFSNEFLASMLSAVSRPDAIAGLSQN